MEDEGNRERRGNARQRTKILGKTTGREASEKKRIITTGGLPIPGLEEGILDKPGIAVVVVAVAFCDS